MPSAGRLVVTQLPAGLLQLSSEALDVTHRQTLEQTFPRLEMPGRDGVPYTPQHLGIELARILQLSHEGDEDAELAHGPKLDGHRLEPPAKPRGHRGVELENREDLAQTP